MGTVLTIILDTTSSPLLNNIQSRIDNLVYDQRFGFMLESPPDTRLYQVYLERIFTLRNEELEED